VGLVKGLNNGWVIAFNRWASPSWWNAAKVEEAPEPLPKALDEIKRVTGAQSSWTAVGLTDKNKLREIVDWVRSVNEYPPIRIWRVTPENRRAVMVEMRRAGLPLRAIAQAFGVSRTRIHLVTYPYMLAAQGVCLRCGQRQAVDGDVYCFPCRAVLDRKERQLFLRP
jgi:hypothetical protein